MTRKIVFILIVLLVFYFVLTYAFYVGVASRVAGANDFYSRWMGARAVFLKGQDPYSDAVTREIQMGMYGRLARIDEDQVAFAYPLYAAYFAAPLVALPYAWAESLWVAFLIMVLVGACILFARSVGWSLAPLGLLALLAIALTFYPALRGIFLGQYALLVFGSMAMGIAMLVWERDGLAGWVLAVSTVKPHVAVIALIVIFSWAVWHKRWRVLVGFISAMALLLGGSFLLLPSWFGEFIRALGEYKSYIQIGPPVQVIGELFLSPPWSEIAAIGISILLIGWLIHRWRRTIGADVKSFLPTIELALIVTTAAMVRTATTDQTLLLLPWLHWLGELNHLGHRVMVVLIGISIIVIPWAIFLSTLVGNQEAPIATTSGVVLTLIGYFIMSLRARPIDERKEHLVNVVD